MSDWIPLVSSNLQAYSYDPQDQTLQVRFKSGRVYSYATVPAHVAEGLTSAPSPGRYFNEQIRDVFPQS